MLYWQAHVSPAYPSTGLAHQLEEEDGKKEDVVIKGYNTKSKNHRRKVWLPSACQSASLRFEASKGTLQKAMLYTDLSVAAGVTPLGHMP